MLARALIVLLLVLNLGVAAWWILRDDTPTANGAADSRADGVARLQLVSERRKAVPPAPATVPAQPGETTNPAAVAAATEPAAPNACYSLGPFADNAAAVAAQTALAGRVAGSRLRRESRPGSGNWDVAIAPQADRVAAQVLAAKIDAAGFKDYYIVATGEGANGIALGRFGTEQAAQRHLTALQAAGFPAQLRSPEAVERHWLDVTVAPEVEAQALRRLSGAAQAEPGTCAG